MEHYEHYCRTCFRPNYSKHNEFKKFVFDAVSQISEIRIDEMIMYCLQVEISPYDRLPQQICDTCLSLLNSIFLFRKQYYRADTEFRKLLKCALPLPAPLESAKPKSDLERDLLDAVMPDQSEANIEQISGKPMDHIPNDHPDEPAGPIPNDQLEIQEIKIEPDEVVEEPDQQPPTAMKKKEDQDQQSSVEVKTNRFRMFECVECAHRASYKGNLVRHQACWNHTGIKVIESNDDQMMKVSQVLCCEECDYQTCILSKILCHLRAKAHTKYKTHDIALSRTRPETREVCRLCKARRFYLQEHTAKWCPMLYGRKEKPRMSTNKFAALLSTDSPGELSKSTEPVERPIIVKRYSCKMYECKQCKLKATFKGNLVRHQRNMMHSGIRVVGPDNATSHKQIKTLHQCEECEYYSFQSVHFLRHQKLWRHTQSSTRHVEVDVVLKKYPQCPHCGETRANLEQHMARSCPKLVGHKRKKANPPGNDSSGLGSAVSEESDGSSAVPSSMQLDGVKLETEDNVDVH